MSEYAFRVLPVEHCPMCKEDWGNASSRLGCNSTHGYQCVPDKHLTSLIEFCYPRGTNVLFQKGLKHFFIQPLKLLTDIEYYNKFHKLEEQYFKFVSYPFRPV